MCYPRSIMSLYSECSAAAAKLLEKPPAHLGGVFSEIDVVNKASHKGWTDEDFKDAMRHANAVLGTWYRSRRVCRYGPVTLPNGSLDYARIASKLTYAPADKAPEQWETPNGTFPKVMIENDPLSRRKGRNQGINRTDLESWDKQDLTLNGDASTEDLKRRVQELEGEVTSRNHRVAELEEKLRQRGEEPEEDVWGFVQKLARRLDALEGAHSE